MILGVIYVITNLINGMKYVGQTRQKLGRRISQHKRRNLYMPTLVTGMDDPFLQRVDNFRLT